MHFPKFFLRVSSFGRFRGAQRMWMSLHGGEVTKDKTQIGREKISNLLDGWINLKAFVAVFEECNQSINRPMA